MATPLRSVRIPDETWDSAMVRATREDTTVTAVVLASVDQYGTGQPLDPTTARAVTKINSFYVWDRQHPLRPSTAEDPAPDGSGNSGERARRHADAASWAERCLKEGTTYMQLAVACGGPPERYLEFVYDRRRYDAAHAAVVSHLERTLDTVRQQAGRYMQESV